MCAQSAQLALVLHGTHHKAIVEVCGRLQGERIEPNGEEGVGSFIVQ